MKKIYFLSDAHLGSRALADNAEREVLLCHFLDSVRQDAQAVYLLGDMFDFWFEYHNLVPKGGVRFLGKLAELTDMGIEVHYFTGNHDMWAFDYLQQECGVVLHTCPTEISLPRPAGDAIPAFIGHGDGLGHEGRTVALLQGIFHSRLCRWLFRNILPADIGMEPGLRWAKSSRTKHSGRKTAENGAPLTIDTHGRLLNEHGDLLTANIDTELPFQGEDREPLVVFAKKHLCCFPHTRFFIFGHRHIELDLMLASGTRLLILGEWIKKFTFAVWDGEQLLLDSFED